MEWINVGLSYLPYLHRFYGPADARAAFLAVCDMAAHYGGHIIGIPRDSLPILEKQDGSGPLWEAGRRLGAGDGLSHLRWGRAGDLGFWRAGFSSL